MLPHSVKEFALQGIVKKRHLWRYGDTLPTLVEEAAERETWSFNQWKTYQENELEKVLHSAYHKVPYYKKQWSERRQKGDTSSYDNIDNWPILTKDELRNNNSQFLAEDKDPKKMYQEHTSGTSGKPLNVYWSKDTTQFYYSLVERRIRNWHGININDKYLMIGGQLVVPYNQKKPPYWVRVKSINQMYLSSYHISIDTIKHYAEAINKFQPKYMFGYASSMYSLAYFIKQTGIKIQPLTAAISNAEPLLNYQKELIEEVFNCTMVNTYGMSELVAAGCTYKTDEMVLFPEVGIINTYDFNEDKIVADQAGRFICTGIINKDMPLIKYELGDSGTLGRSTIDKLDYISITSIEGRTDDMVITKNGRRIGRLDPVFKKDLNIVEAQIIQETLDDFTLKIVPDKNYTDADGINIINSLKQRIGETNITINLVNHIERTNTGKFKAVVSKIEQ